MMQEGDETVLQVDLTKILEKLQAESKYLDGFFDNLLTRNEWSDVLGISRSTIWRWEKEIIEKVFPVKDSYFDKKAGLRSNYLDDYQRFIIACIYVVKEQLFRHKEENSVAVNFLKMNFMQLKRQQFEEWRDKHVHQR